MSVTFDTSTYESLVIDSTSVDLKCLKTPKDLKAPLHQESSISNLTLEFDIQGSDSLILSRNVDVEEAFSTSTFECTEQKKAVVFHDEADVYLIPTKTEKLPFVRSTGFKNSITSKIYNCLPKIKDLQLLTRSSSIRPKAVKFNKVVTVFPIQSHRNFNHATMETLWYNTEDIEKMKEEVFGSSDQKTP